MKKRGERTPWMDSVDFGRSLRGVGLNLLVADVALSAAFLTEVLGLDEIYCDPDIGVLRHADHVVILHADHSYMDEGGTANAMLARCRGAGVRGAGAELRLYGIDADAAEARARARGDTVLAASGDTAHGLRECYLVDPDGYVWVPGAVIQP